MKKLVFATAILLAISVTASAQEKKEAVAEGPAKLEKVNMERQKKEQQVAESKKREAEESKKREEEKNKIEAEKRASSDDAQPVSAGTVAIAPNSAVVAKDNKQIRKEVVEKPAEEKKVVTANKKTKAAVPVKSKVKQANN